MDIIIGLLGAPLSTSLEHTSQKSEENVNKTEKNGFLNTFRKVQSPLRYHMFPYLGML